MAAMAVLGVTDEKMTVLFQSLDSGQTITLCVDFNTLSRILECYDIQLNVGAVDNFFAYNRVFFFSPPTCDYSFNVSALDALLVYGHIIFMLHLV